MLILNKHHRQTDGQTGTNTHRVASLLINYMEITCTNYLQGSTGIRQWPKIDVHSQ